MSANLDNGVMLGALGSSFVKTDGAVKPPKGMVIAAIQFITGGGSGTGVVITELIAENPTLFFNTAQAANSASSGSETGATSITATTGSGGDTMGDSVPFPAGMTIYGRWTSASFSADSDGGVICYFGY